MRPFVYSNSPFPIRAELADAYRFAWQQIGSAGTWWTAEERVAIAAEVRAAATCPLCARRKAALSPYGDEEEHAATDVLSARAVDLVHRLTTDASRLTRTFLVAQFDDQLTDAHYVELLSVVVATLCIDSFNATLGFEPEPLPEPQPGLPSRYRPEAARLEGAWIPTIPAGRLAEQDADLYEGIPVVANVLRCLSLVPDGLRLFKRLSSAQYLPMAVIRDPAAETDRALTRPQIELVAGRVSAINDCFY